MLNDLLGHVIEESDSRYDPALSGAVEGEVKLKSGLIGVSHESGAPHLLNLSARKEGGNFIPALTCQHDGVPKLFRHTLISKPDSPGTEGAGKLHVRLPVPDHKRGGKIPLPVLIGLQHGLSRLSSGTVVLRKGEIHVNVGKEDPFPRNRTHDEVLGLLIDLPRQGRGSHPVLVAYEHQGVIGVILNRLEGGEDTFHEADVLRSVLMALFHQDAVPVDEESPLLLLKLHRAPP